MRKLLSPINYSTSGLEPATHRDVTALPCVIDNYRHLIHSLGFDCSLMPDRYILGFGDAIKAYEDNSDSGWLLDTLDYLTLATNNSSDNQN